MQDIILDIERWSKQNLPIGLATVISTWGSSPRQVGAKMAFTTQERISGSVSGGCVESAVYDAGIQAVANDESQVLQFGVSDEFAFDVGLACGGNIEVFVRKLNYALFQVIMDELHSKKSMAIVSILQGNRPLPGCELIVNEAGIVWGTIDAVLDRWALDFARQAIHSDQSQVIEPSLVGYEGLRIFVDVINPPPLLVMVGGTHITITLAALTKSIGYRTTVIDPRRAFGNAERFPEVDQLLQDWPQEAFKQVLLTHNTAVAILTHDPKIDDPALKITLDSPVFYIGALGSRMTHQKRCQRLLADGISSFQLERIHSPIGIDLSGRTPEEVALSILAEIVLTRRRGQDGSTRV